MHIVLSHEGASCPLWEVPAGHTEIKHPSWGVVGGVHGGLIGADSLISDPTGGSETGAASACRARGMMISVQLGGGAGKQLAPGVKGAGPTDPK